MIGSLKDNPAFTYWVISVVLLFLKMYANSAVQGFYRIRDRTFVRPEDAAFFGKNGSPAATDHPMAELAARCWRNDLENIPIFLFLSLAYVLAGGGGNWAAVYCGVFLVARVVHTIFMLKPRQPHRNLAYQAGMVVCLALAVHDTVLILAS